METAMGISLCIHKSAEEIGGNCIEIKTSTGERLLLDAGRPLDTPDGEQTPIPLSLNTETPVSGILLSHAHIDHSGLLENLPGHWPVYCGKATERQLRLSAAVSGKNFSQPCHPWINGKAIRIGPFTVIPHLIDHSAFDAYALQINVESKTLIYSGDFRVHGRKAKLTEALMHNPPPRVDVLLLEGTNLRTSGLSSKATQSEALLEEEFTHLFVENAGRIFVSWAATNIDRVVTLYRACKKSERCLVVDLYSALVLMQLKEFADIPQPEWPDGNMRVVVTKKMMRLMDRLRETGLIEYLKSHQVAMSARKLVENPHKWVIMVRNSMVEDYSKKGVVPTEDDTWVWSMWNGYLEQDSSRLMRDFFAPCKKTYIHSSGHASPEMLVRFAEAMQPATLIPVHGEAWQEHKEKFPNVRIVQNGEWITI